MKSQVTKGPFAFYGTRHESFQLPQWSLWLAYVLVAGTCLAVVTLGLRRYIKTGETPAMPGVAAFAAIYFWYLPTFSHPGYAYLIPLFHSLQYLAFVGALKRGSIREELAEYAIDSEAWRRGWLLKTGSFVILTVGLGVLLFKTVPNLLDGAKLLAGAELGPSPFLVAFLVFINIHHYFIDNVIWRSSNEVVRRHLFGTPQVPLKEVA